MSNEMTQDERNQMQSMINSLYAELRQQKNLIAMQKEMMDMHQKELDALKAEGSKIHLMAIKPPKPEMYRGVRDATEINSWIDQVKRYADHHHIGEQDVPSFAIF